MKIHVHAHDAASPTPKGSQWITLEDGGHVLINGSGQVIAGAGGALNGKHYASAKTVPFKKEELKKFSDMTHQEKAKAVIENTNGKEWKSADGSKHCIYFDDALERIGLKVNRRGAGRISGATLNGKEISNNKAKEILNTFEDAKIYYDVKEDYFYGPNSPYLDAVTASIRKEAEAGGNVPLNKEESTSKAEGKPRSMPTTGRINENDPSLYGHELLGWEGHTWREFHSRKATELAEQGRQEQPTAYGEKDDEGFVTYKLKNPSGINTPEETSKEDAISLPAKSYGDAQRILNEKGSRDWEIISKDEKDAEGHEIKAWYVTKKEQKKGMTQAEAKQHEEEANRDRPFGRTWQEIEQMQGGKLKYDLPGQRKAK